MIEQSSKKSAVKIINEENFEIETETELRIMKNESKSKRLAGISAREKLIRLLRNEKDEI